MPSKPSREYDRALSEILALEKFGSHLGLGRISRILKLLGNPQQSFQCVLVAGSNGKGSTTEMIGCALSAASHRTGTYFSPQIEEFPERFRVNGKNAGKKEIAAAYAAVRAVCRKEKIPATFFEVVTAMALVIFKAGECDYAVLEVGLGGRLDATNAVEPALSALTSISLEHTDVLGGTIGKIAREKCGIARRGRALVCGFLSPEAKNAVAKECKRIGALPIFTEEKVAIPHLKENRGRHSFFAEFEGAKYRLSLSAPGKFQISNSCVALAACARLGVPRSAIERGISRALPKFRFQKISSRPLTIADCAHNPEAAAALARELDALPCEKKVLLFSAMKDKDYGAVLAALAPHFEKIVLTEVPVSRSATLRELFSQAKKRCANVTLVQEPKRALGCAKRLAGGKGVLVVAGSIYLLAELYGKDE